MARRNRGVRLLLCAAGAMLFVALTGTAEEPQAAASPATSAAASATAVFRVIICTSHQPPHLSSRYMTSVDATAPILT